MQTQQGATGRIPAFKLVDHPEQRRLSIDVPQVSEFVTLTWTVPDPPALIPAGRHRPCIPNARRLGREV